MTEETKKYVHLSSLICYILMYDPIIERKKITAMIDSFGEEFRWVTPDVFEATIKELKKYGAIIGATDKWIFQTNTTRAIEDGNKIISTLDMISILNA